MAVKRRSTCAADVIEGACQWAVAIASDNRFHYGNGGPSHHNGCYFCGTNTLKGKAAKKGVVDYKFSYCCNPFVGAAFAHGGGEPTALKLCKKRSSWDYHVGKGYDASKLFRKIKHDRSLLKRGDVLCRNTHVALYIGNGKIVHARGQDDGKRNSTSWNNSIRVETLTDKNWKNFPRVYRYIGNGGGIMDIPDGATITAEIAEETTASIVDSGAGIVLEQQISKLWSSDNYEYVVQEENLENESVTKFKESVHLALSGSGGTSAFDELSRVTSAIPEIVLSSNSSLSDLNFDYDKPKRLKSVPTTSLLSFPSLVEAPTIVLDFNGIKIGGYGNTGDKYPNYIKSMEIKKVNGRINTYTINLDYQVRPGEDPNFIDKLISRTGYRNPLRILYGDSNYPTVSYREEETIITDVKHNEDVASYTIHYNITALSSLAVAQVIQTNFNNATTRPSTAINELLYDSGELSDSMINLFPGMANRNEVARLGLIPTNDKVVNIGGMNNVNPITYLGHLVSCMADEAVSNSTYFLSFVDNTANNLGGSYFKISEVLSANNTLMDNILIPSNTSVFELDIGFPSNNFITNFQVCNNDLWSLVYKYAGDISQFEYGIDDNGDLITNKRNILTLNDKYGISSLINDNWWKQVTEFPISARVTLKGLINPVLLMSYIKVNTLFYGQRDLASGLYVVTEQVDSISGNGYSTTLTLLRVAGE